MSNLSVEDVIDGAILEGFNRGSASFLEGLEDSIRNSLVIQESGDAVGYLQQMINEAEGASVGQDVNELQEKLSRVLG